MSFTDEKIYVLKQLLFQYDFSKGFTTYYNETKYTDSRTELAGPIDIGDSTLPSKHSLTSRGNLALFPVVFDFFDAVIDKKLGTNNQYFSEKVQNFISHPSVDAVVGFIERKSFEKSVEIRNKIVHNNLVFNENDELVLPSGTVYPVSVFPSINRLLFNVAYRCLNSEEYSLYDKCAALSLFREVFSEEQCEHILRSDIISDMSVVPRFRENYCERTVPKDKPLYDFLSRPIEMQAANGRSIFEDGLSSNYTFLFDLNGVKIVLPAELIKKHRERTLEDFSEWSV